MTTNILNHVKKRNELPPFLQQPTLNDKLEHALDRSRLNDSTHSKREAGLVDPVEFFTDGDSETSPTMQNASISFRGSNSPRDYRPSSPLVSKMGKAPNRIPVSPGRPNALSPSRTGQRSVSPGFQKSNRSVSPRSIFHVNRNTSPNRSNNVNRTTYDPGNEDIDVGKRQLSQLLSQRFEPRAGDSYVPLSTQQTAPRLQRPSEAEIRSALIQNAVSLVVPKPDDKILSSSSEEKLQYILQRRKNRLGNAASQTALQASNQSTSQAPMQSTQEKSNEPTEPLKGQDRLETRQSPYLIRASSNSSLTEENTEKSEKDVSEPTPFIPSKPFEVNEYMIDDPATVHFDIEDESDQEGEANQQDSSTIEASVVLDESLVSPIPSSTMASSRQSALLSPQSSRNGRTQVTFSDPIETHEGNQRAVQVNGVKDNVKEKAVEVVTETVSVSHQVSPQTHSIKVQAETIESIPSPRVIDVAETHFQFQGKVEPESQENSQSTPSESVSQISQETSSHTQPESSEDQNTQNGETQPSNQSTDATEINTNENSDVEKDNAPSQSTQVRESLFARLEREYQQELNEEPSPIRGKRMEPGLNETQEETSDPQNTASTQSTSQPNTFTQAYSELHSRHNLSASRSHVSNSIFSPDSQKSSFATKHTPLRTNPILQSPQRTSIELPTDIIDEEDVERSITQFLAKLSPSKHARSSRLNPSHSIASPHFTGTPQRQSIAEDSQIGRGTSSPYNSSMQRSSLPRSFPRSATLQNSSLQNSPLQNATQRSKSLNLDLGPSTLKPRSGNEPPHLFSFRDAHQTPNHNQFHGDHSFSRPNLRKWIFSSERLKEYRASSLLSQESLDMLQDMRSMNIATPSNRYGTDDDSEFPLSPFSTNMARGSFASPYSGSFMRDGAVQGGLFSLPPRNFASEKSEVEVVEVKSKIPMSKGLLQFWEQSKSFMIEDGGKSRPAIRFIVEGDDLEQSLSQVDEISPSIIKNKQDNLTYLENGTKLYKVNDKGKLEPKFIFFCEKYKTITWRKTESNKAGSDAKPSSSSAVSPSEITSIRLFEMPVDELPKKIKQKLLTTVTEVYVLLINTTKKSVGRMELLTTELPKARQLVVSIAQTASEYNESS